MIYHYLQAKSDRYPFVSFYTARKHFFNAIAVDYCLDTHFFDEAAKRADHTQEGTYKVLNRSEWIVFIVLLAK